MASRQEPGYSKPFRVAFKIGKIHYVELFFGGEELLKNIEKHLDRQLLGHIYSFLDIRSYGLMCLEPVNAYPGVQETPDVQLTASQRLDPRDGLAGRLDRDVYPKRLRSVRVDEISVAL